MDGVLNCSDTWKGPHADQWATLDPDMVDRLGRIVEATGALLVLSSTWRTCQDREANGEHKCLPKLHSWLKERGMEIFSETPVFDGFIRGYEISDWFRLHREFEDSPYVILDDMFPSDFLEDQRPFLIQTFFGTTNGMPGGLQDRHVDRAIKILNESN